MKEVRCYSCGSIRIIDDAVAIKICRGCNEIMMEINREGIEVGLR